MDQRVSRSHPNIHIVDDDAAVRQALAFALELEGFHVETYEFGEALLRREPPPQSGCLVLDERLPGASGLDTLRQLRARHVTLPAVFVTSHPKPSFRAEAETAGVPILEKPLEAATLIEAILAMLAPADPPA